MNNIVSIIIPAMNLSWQTKLCISAISQNVDYPFEVIVVNNASIDDTKEYLDNEAESILKENPNFKNFVTIHNEHNIFLAGANNLGVKNSVGKYISLVANDIVVPKNMYSFLINKLEEDKKIGAIGPWYIEDSNALKLDPDKLESVQYFLELMNGKEDTIKNEWHFSVCHIMRREVWDYVGPWDNKLWTHCQDNDWGIRLSLAGYKAITYKQFVCYHHYGSLGRKQIPGETQVAAKDTAYFYNKWKIYSNQKNDEIPENIREIAKKGNYLL